jgi:hypothetical protein
LLCKLDHVAQFNFGKITVAFYQVTVSACGHFFKFCQFCFPNITDISGVEGVLSAIYNQQGLRTGDGLSMQVFPYQHANPIMELFVKRQLVLLYRTTSCDTSATKR